MEMVAIRTASAARGKISGEPEAVTLEALADTLSFASLPISPTLAAAMHRHRQACAKTRRVERLRPNDQPDRDLAALVSVVETPAAHMRDLLAKVLFMQKEDYVDVGAIQAIAADIRRLGGEA